MEVAKIGPLTVRERKIELCIHITQAKMETILFEFSIKSTLMNALHKVC